MICELNLLFSNPFWVLWRFVWLGKFGGKGALLNTKLSEHYNWVLNSLGDPARSKPRRSRTVRQPWSPCQFPLKQSWLQKHPSAQSLLTESPTFLFDGGTLIDATLSWKAITVTLYLTLSPQNLKNLILYDWIFTKFMLPNTLISFPLQMGHVCEPSCSLILPTSRFSVCEAALNPAHGQQPGWVGDGLTAAYSPASWPPPWESPGLSLKRTQFCACGNKL